MTQFRDPQQAENDIARLRVGALIDGRIRLEDLLGEGAGSYVYRAHHSLLGKKVAVKILKAALANDPRSLNRFMQEARIANGITHRNIARVTAFGVFEQTPYLVMDYLEGRTLQDALASKTLDINEGIRLVMETADALAHLHANGLVHRDIKPSNIMLVVEDGKEHAKLLDLGIVKNFETNSMHEFQQLTQTGTLVGTPMYMSPEQCTGKALDQRSDIYSLGCVLFELIEGVAPFVGTNALETMFMHSNSPVPALQNGSDKLKAVISKSLQKQPELRQQTVSDLIAELAECPSENGTAGQPKRKGLRLGFNRNCAIVLVLIICALAAAVASTVFNHRHAEKRRILPTPLLLSGNDLPLPHVESADAALAQLDASGLDFNHPWGTNAEVLKNCFALCEAGLEAGGSPAACCRLAHLGSVLIYVVGGPQHDALSKQTNLIAGQYASNYISTELSQPRNNPSMAPQELDEMLGIVLPILQRDNVENRLHDYDRILDHVPEDAQPTVHILELHYDHACRVEDGTMEQFKEFKYVYDTLKSTSLPIHRDLLELYSKYLASLLSASNENPKIRELQMLEMFKLMQRLKPTALTIAQKKPYTNLHPQNWAAQYCSTMTTIVDLLAADPANKQLCLDTYAELVPIAQFSGQTLLQDQLKLGPPIASKAENQR